MQSIRGLSGAVVVAVAVLAGCHERDVNRGLSDFSASPEDVNFGAVAVGRDRLAEVTLENNGRVPFNVTDVTATVPNVVVEGFEPVRLEAGAKHTVMVRFAPEVEGAVTGALQIATDESPDASTIELKGLGVRAFAEVGTDNLEFGEVETHTSKVESILVTNPTQVETMVRFTIDGDDRDEFSSSEAEHELVLAPGEQRQIPIAFKPIRLGLGIATATFSLCQGCEPFVVGLTGEGIADKLDVYPTRVDFGRVSLGATATETVTIRNLGTEAVPFNGARLEYASGVFTVSALAKTLARNESAEVTVTFTPKATTKYNDILKLDVVAENVPSGLNLSVLGEGGVSCVALFPAVIDFGTVPEGMSATKKVDVLNRCAYDVTLDDQKVSTTQGGYFSVGQMSGMVVIAPGKMAPVNVTFTPKPGVTNSEGALSIKVMEKSVLSTVQVPLKGASKTFAPCNWSLTPLALDFGALPVGSEATLGVALKNVGTDQCFVGGMQLASGSDAEFKADVQNSTLLDPGQQLVLKVKFKPSAVGTFAALAEAWVNHPTNGHPTATLTGEGVQGCFALQPTDVDFGTVKLTCGSRTRSVIGYNSCTAPVTISNVTLDAPFTTDFSLTQQPSLPAVIQPGKQVMFEVTYSPMDDGDDTAALRVTADGKSYTAGVVGLGLSKPTKTDVFVQESQTKVDVLFVIDNSGSMMEEQQNLGANFNAFLQAAQSQFVDYQVAVTTTGIDPSPGGWSVCPGGVDGGEAGRLFPVVGTNPRIITPSTPNAAQVFAQNVQVGWCHWNEQGLEAAYRALSAPLVNSADDTRTSQPNDGNGGFLRPDAKLAIVFLSDEDDYSTQPVTFYETFFKSVKNNDAQQLTMSAIVGPSNLASCPTASSSGTRYIAMANATGGIVESICTTDWAKSLQNLGWQTFGPKRKFALNDTPADPAQVTVTVNGVPATAGTWTYDPASNSVEFDEGSAPAAGSVIEVTYPLGC